MAEYTGSVLAVDVGSVHTRLILLDLVEGQYKLIASTRARTTAEPPLASASLGLERAAEQMTELVGRQLIGNEPERSLFITPETDGHGIDEFFATSSAGRPMRVFLVGLTPEISLYSARRMLGGSYVSITDTLNPDDLRNEEAKINDILRGEPDLILIVGGTDDGADETVLEQVATVQKALSLIRHGAIPTVLFAGNQALKRQVNSLLAPLTTVFYAKNVRPSLHEEQLFPAQIELALVYDDYRSKGTGGFAEVGRQSQVGVVPTIQGYISAIRYMSQLPQKGTGPLCIDVGSASSVLVTSMNREPYYAVRTDVGVGHNMVGALEAVTPANVLRWLPFDLSADDLWDYAYNKQLRPATVPGTPEEVMIEQAVAREIIRLMVDEARPAWGLSGVKMLPNFRPVIAAGAVLTEAPHPGIAALTLLDALQPSGIVELELDAASLVPLLGVIAYLRPLVTVQALETGGMVRLGTAFCPLGSSRYGKDAMFVRIRQPDGTMIRKTIKGGDIWMAPVLPGVTAEVTIKLRRGLTINGKHQIKRLHVVAGAAGIIFDARGRPMPMPRPRDRAARLMKWQLAMSGRDAEPVMPGGPDLTELYPDLDIQEEPVSALPS